MFKNAPMTMLIYIGLIIAIAIGGIYMNNNSIALSHLNILESFESYESCVGQFYPDWWCMRVPKQNEGENGYCHCGNGQMGTFLFDGKCNCYPNNPTFPYYAENKFFDYPANK